MKKIVSYKTKIVELLTKKDNISQKIHKRYNIKLFYKNYNVIRNSFKIFNDKNNINNFI